MKLVDIPTSIHDECRQVWHSPVMLNCSLAARQKMGLDLGQRNRGSFAAPLCGGILYLQFCLISQDLHDVVKNSRWKDVTPCVGLHPVLD